MHVIAALAKLDAMTMRIPDIHTLAFRARDMQPEERQAFVRRQCDEDVTQISKVYELLKTIVREPSSDSDNHAAPESNEPEWQPTNLIGTRLGAYELTKLLGTGGMGAVFLAQRSDAEFQHKVAIKLVRNSMLSINIAARLRAERQMMASLQHPHIAMLMDGGTANDGTPYLVMEYIDGMTIDAYCDRNKFSIEHRLRMFLKVCSAVQCAHQNLIVHRDLKPTNILVNQEGQPKLLDFGIAKLLDTQIPHRHINLTQHDMRMLTPAHASPEQILGDVITTSSDIYVLGVLLYELLCGCRPLNFPKQFRLLDLEHIICSAKPVAPSAMVHRVERESAGFMQDIARCRSISATKLKRVLKRDLDNIVMMAMRKEPVRRYSSVEQLANDIKNWLDGLPVMATKDSWSYRASKFVHRYIWAIGGLSAAFVAFVIFTIALMMQSYETAKQRDALERERNRAEQVSSFLLDLFRYSDPTKTRGNELKARELLDAGAKRIDAALDAQPMLRATMLDTIGQVYSNMGLNDDAVISLEKSLNTRLAQSGENSLEVADVLVHLGEVRIYQDNTTDAIKLLNRAVQIRQQLLGSTAIELATPLRLLGKANVDAGNYNEGEDNIFKALSLLDSHGQSGSVEKALALSALAESRTNQYRAADAEIYYRSALSMLIADLGLNDPIVMQVRVDFASTLESLGKFSEAQPIMAEALAEKRRTLGSMHPQTISALEAYGIFLTRKGDYVQAKLLLDEALQANTKLHGEQHSLIGYDYVNLGILEFMRGNYALSEQLYRSAMVVYSHTLEPNNVYVAAAELSLARVLVRLNKTEEAIMYARHALDKFVAIYGTENPMTQRATAALGIALVAAHRLDEAKPLLVSVRPFIESMTDRQELRREFQDALTAVKP